VDSPGPLLRCLVLPEVVECPCPHDVLGCAVLGLCCLVPVLFPGFLASVCALRWLRAGLLWFCAGAYAVLLILPCLSVTMYNLHAYA
jgi:hypothetical protein